LRLHRRNRGTAFLQEQSDFAAEGDHLARIFAVLAPVAVAGRGAAFRSGGRGDRFFWVQLPDLTVKRLNEFSNRCR
jgi:hypothetical protein